ncbi:MAG: energy-coupling factor transporter transmembrane protein EcfT [Bacillota bacterium]|nr:MAG: energy-coupling factor transporter transmembrane protein EcfT [Bacillota bacterium]
MLRDITIGQYLSGSSVVHRLDPRTKITVVGVFMIVLFTAINAQAYVVLVGFAVLSVVLAEVPPRMLFRGLRPVLFLLMLTFALQLFLTRGHVLFTLGPLVATWEGLRQGIFMVLRLLLLLVMASLLTLTTSPVSLTDGLEAILGPFRFVGVPAHELAMMMTIALRFIPTLMEEADKIMKAQMARGADFESGNPIRRARSLIPLLVPLFVSAFRRADELATAMESRCYRGGHKRTRLHRLRATGLDAYAAAVTAGMALIVIGLRWWIPL